MDNWVKNLHDLKYLPERMNLIVQHVPEFDITTGNGKEPSQADLIAYSNPEDWRTRLPSREDWQRNELNYFRAIRNLYQKFGWPNQFDREGFLSVVDDFRKRVDDYDRRLKRSNPNAFWPVPDVIFTPEEMEMRKEKDDFLQETAGPLAIRRLEQ
jgi:hypothetical protein